MSDHQTETVDRFGLESVRGTVSGRQDGTTGHDQHGAESNDHLTSIYKDQDDQFEAVIPFIQQGLKRGERCLYIADDNTPEEVRAALRAGGIDVAGACNLGSLSIHTKADTYLRTGEFDQEAVLDFWQQTLAEAREDGYAGIRAATEMTWALNEETGLEQLVEYEATLNTIYPGEDYVVLCQYNRERFPTAVLSDVIRTHPLVVSDRTVCQNVHYQPPVRFFETDRPPLDVDQTIEGLGQLVRVQHLLQEHEALTDTEGVITVLNTVLRAAADNGTLERYYTCRNEAAYPDWEVTITPIQKPPEPSDDD